jgi:hypothetical protein
MAAEPDRCSVSPLAKSMNKSADDRLDDLAAAVHMQCRDGRDLVSPGHTGVVLDVEPDDLDLVVVLVGELIQLGRQEVARPAPLGPEVHHNGLFISEDVPFEGLIGHAPRLLRHCDFPASSDQRRDRTPAAAPYLSGIVTVLLPDTAPPAAACADAGSAVVDHT